jgi:hypothetical protein
MCPVFPRALLIEPSHQGIDGPIVLTGFTPELDDFTLRVVDGRFPSLASVLCLNSVSRAE